MPKNGNMSLSNHGPGPNVEAAFNQYIEPSADRKTIIGARKPAVKKSGVGKTAVIELIEKYRDMFLYCIIIKPCIMFISVSYSYADDSRL